MTFQSSKVIEYKLQIQNAIIVYTIFIEKVKSNIKVLNPLLTNEQILTYIGYLYELSLYNGLLYGINTQLPLINRFLENPEIMLNEREQRLLMQAVRCEISEIPKLMSYEIETIPRFPCLAEVVPISTSGIVGDSEIYISTLLYGLATNDSYILEK